MAIRIRHLLLLSLILIAVAVAAYPYFAPYERSFGVRYAEQKTFSDRQVGFACDAIADATLFEDPIGRKVEARAGAGTDKIALKINEPNGIITLLTRAAVEIGISEGTDFRIVSADKSLVIATAAADNLNSGLSVIIFDRKNANALWTKANRLLGLAGQSYFFECR